MTTYPMPRPNPFIKVVMLLVGATRGTVDLDEQSMTVRLGFAFRATVPRGSIIGAELDPTRELSIGAHGWGGHWLVNTSARNIVRLVVSPTARGWLLGVPVRLRELRLSLDDPAAFLAALGHGTGQSTSA